MLMRESVPFCVVSQHVASFRNIPTPELNKDLWYTSKPRQHNFAVSLNKTVINLIAPVMSFNVEFMFFVSPNNAVSRPNYTVSNGKKING